MDLVAGAFSTLKGASDIAQGFLAMKTDAAVSAKAVELNRVIADVQQQLFSIQAAYATTIRREEDLKAEIVRLKDWSHEKQRYELHEVTTGSLAYRVKPAMNGGEPVHYLCANCYQDNVKSILQHYGSEGFHKRLYCPKCNSSFLGERYEFGPLHKIRNDDERGAW